MQDLQNRHMEYFLKLTHEAEPKLKGAEQKLWMDRLENEYDNLRAAWEWAIETDVEMALQLAWALLEFWGAGWHLPESRDWLARLLSYAEGWGQSSKRARALIIAGAVASYQRDSVISCQLLEQGLAIAEKNGAAFEIAFAHSMLGRSNFFRVELTKARKHFETSLVLWRECGDELDIAVA